MENEVIDNNLIDLIRIQLNRLDKMTQEIMILKTWEELNFEEISQVVKENINTVKTIYYKGINDLKLKLNSKNNLKTKALTTTLILSSLFFISKDNEFSVSDAIEKKLLNQSLFFNTINMNSTMSAAGSVAKMGILATTTGKIFVGITSVAVIIAAGTSVVLINNSNKPSGPQATISSSLSTQSSNNSSVSNSVNTQNLSSLSSSSQLNSSASTVSSTSSSNSSSSNTPTGVVTENGKYFTSATYGFKFYYLDHYGIANSKIINDSPCNSKPIERVTFSNSKVGLDFNGCVQGGTDSTTKVVQKDSWLSSNNKNFNFVVYQYDNANKYIVTAIYSAGFNRDVIVQSPDLGNLNTYLTYDQIFEATQDIKEIVNSITFNL